MGAKGIMQALFALEYRLLHSECDQVFPVLLLNGLCGAQASLTGAKRLLVRMNLCFLPLVALW